MLNKYKFGVNKDLNITLNLSTNVNLEGDNGRSLLENETNSSINEARSGDKIRIKKLNNTTVRFNFYDGDGFIPNLSGAGFTDSDLTTIGENVFSSFFFFRVYDTPNLSQGNLLHTSYLNGYQIYTQYRSSTVISLSGVQEYNNIYLQERLVDTNIAYVKFNYYNAKTGIIHNFISDETNGELVEINIINNEYNFVDTVVNLTENTNISYNTNINDNNKSNTIETPNYPPQKGFDNGDYVLI